MKQFAFFFLLSLLIGCSGKEPAVSEPQIHPDFALTASELRIILQPLPSEIQSAIMEKPQVFLDLLLSFSREPESRTVWVDKEHILSGNYAPAQEMKLEDYSIPSSKPGMTVSGEIIPRLTALITAAKLEGLSPVVSSAYRSYETQERVYNYWVSELGQEEADRVSAQPGKSQHQLGTTLDFGTISLEDLNTPEGQWLMNNAYRFGFSLSYPEGYEGITGYSFEPWHFRYIGDTGIQLQRNFFQDIQHFLYQFYHTQGQVILETLVSEKTGEE